MIRATRQIRLLEIISANDIDTQDVLVSMLHDEGFNVTQATISRDIKEMNIVKVMTEDAKGGRHYKYVTEQQKEVTASDKFLKIFKTTVLSIRCGGQLIVLKTETGSAGPAAALIDKLDYPEVMGVIAGDDTIFVAAEDETAAEIIADKLDALLY